MVLFLDWSNSFFEKKNKKNKKQTTVLLERIFLIQTKREEKRKKHARILAISLFVISWINTFCEKQSEIEYLFQVKNGTRELHIYQMIYLFQNKNENHHTDV